MAVNRWQDIYLGAGSDDSEYERIYESLTNCPDCAQWGNQGWIAVGVQVDNEEWEQEKNICGLCKGTGLVLSE